MKKIPANELQRMVEDSSNEDNHDVLKPRTSRAFFYQVLVTTIFYSSEKKRACEVCHQVQYKENYVAQVEEEIGGDFKVKYFHRRGSSHTHSHSLL